MNPQTLNLYAIVHDNPETFADLDGHLTIEAGTRSYETEELEERDEEAQKQAQKQGFWSRLGQHFENMARHMDNVLHGNSWNYMPPGAGIVTVTVTQTIREPNPLVTIGADTLGAAGGVTGHSSWGIYGAAISFLNDPTPQNAVMTGLSLVPKIGGPIGWASTGLDVGNVTGNFITNQILAPMFNAAEPQNVDVGGVTMPNPALMDNRDID